MISLLNDVRLVSGKTPLGFLNPLLYSVGSSSLNDITIGSNPGCGTSGFKALKGWDPVCFDFLFMTILKLVAEIL